MKVFNLRCGAQHVFEGWFGSEDDFIAQAAAARIGCPLCGDTDVQRLPSAPRLNLSAAGRAEPAAEAPSDAPAAEARAGWLRAMRQLFERTEDVGERFPEEARRIHYGETEARGIRGRASREQADALAEEGIEVMALPAALQGPQQ